MANEDVPSYITREKCGCIVGAVVDNPDHKKDTAKFLAKAVRDGLTIERVTVGYVREHGLEQCEVHKKEEQPTLLQVNSRNDGK